VSETQRRVPSDAAGGRLDRFLASLPEVGSRAAAEALVSAGAVLVDGALRPKSHRLHGGEEVVFEPPVEEVPAVELPELRVVYEDDDLLVVEKPAGVAVHPGAGRSGGTLAQALAGVAGGGPPERAGIVHRLDRDTSGLLCVAKHEEAFRRLQRLVRRRELEREYLSLARGRPQSRRGTIEAAIGRDRSDPLRRSLDTDAPREAVTHFEVVELLGDYALLRVRLETGRTHQIRVHLAAIDLPVVGDRLYGVPGLGLERQFLHAARIAFAHPFTGKRIEIESPLPPDLAAALARAH
jgi:23S rRNA pseudouridine1911/1915/1917 synthase